jgi:hypothetical protein
MFGRGINITMDPTLEQGSTLSLLASLVEQNHEIGVSVFASEATITDTVVRTTQPNGEGKFGDGILVASNGNPSRATVTSTTIEANSRAGITSFSANVVLLSSTVKCNPINVGGEEDPPGQTFTFDGSKDNLFGCKDPLSSTMSIVSSQLSPPPPINPVKPLD